MGGTGSANYLEDYEEGTFTPIVRSNGSGGGSYTYSGQLGKYVKIGNFVWAKGYVGITSASGGSGYMKFSLPFGSASNTGGYGSVRLENASTSSYTNAVTESLGADAFAYIRLGNISGGGADFDYTHLTTATRIGYEFIYTTP